MPRSINGILLLDKPIAFTSNGALQRVKRLFDAKKAGHTGSLDPLATGMLPICFGEATKFSQYLLDADKFYDVTAMLGVETTTGDTEGEIVYKRPFSHITKENLKNVIQDFIGEIEQIPPMYSAIKHQGKPLYQLARQGISVARKPRKINVFSMELKDYSGPYFSIMVHVSKGTYIRTLAEDIGHVLGCGSHVVRLHRVGVHPYLSSAMYTMPFLEDILNQKGHAGLSSLLLPIDTAMRGLEAMTLSTSAEFYLRTGQAVRSPGPATSGFVRLLSADSRFLGIGEITSGKIKPHRLVSNNYCELVS